jgi:threonine/homoserine/homoserine lactone efflux protein
MTFDATISFCLFAFVSSVTPGPNNFMLLASGLNFGFLTSIPHILGISIGFMIMVMAVGLGLAQIFSYYPLSYIAMKWIGAAYLLYLAWGIATSGAPSIDSEKDKSKPLSFVSAAAFQWVNPKAWVMAVSTFSTYVPGKANVVVIIGVSVLFAIINVPCVTAWALFGVNMRKLLQVAKYRRIFNISMALLIITSLIPLLNAS